MQSQSKKKVYVGLSGGVDSAVSATLLKEQGFDVVGVFIKIWSPDWLGCTSREDRLDAMRVAAHLDIPFREIDLTAEYKKDVVDYMIREYKMGHTPNPDVFCNKYIKFGIFFDWAMREGADCVATGHYARTKDRKLFAAVDQSKDQSYFLWTLGGRQLSKTIFPVGDLKKTDVRKLAKKYKLPNALRRDSQGLCFIGPVDIKDFLAQYVEQKEGDVIDQSGKVIGTHPGALFFTIGERHGFTITEKTPNDEPLYVVEKDIKNNTITVRSSADANGLLVRPQERAKTTRSPFASAPTLIYLSETNWISDAPEKGKTYTARIRHLGDFLSCTYENGKISFEKPTRIAPGQSIVLYDEETCLGGGIVG